MLGYYNDLTVLLSTIFKELELEIDYMGKPNRKTIEYAVKYSPESWCFDTKILLGQAIEAIKRKNNLLTMAGAWGRNEKNCFLGYLTKGVMQKKLEKITGKKINIWFFNANPGELISTGYTAAYKSIYELRKYSKITFFRCKLMRSIILGIKKMNMAAKLKEQIFSSPEIINKEKLFSIYDNFIKEMIFQADTIEKSKEIYKGALIKINKLDKKELKKKLIIGFVGDYAQTLFSFNPFLDIERFLLSQNVSVKQPLSFTNYYSLFSPIYKKENRNNVKKIFPKSVSGSDRVTLMSAMHLKNKVDGIIHIRAFGCMPEEIANEVLISNKKIFPPILSLSYDAHTTEESLKVRIEAFVDMLNNKKKI